MNAKATAASRKHPVFQRECKHSFHSNSYRRRLRGAAAAAAADMRVQVRCTRELRALRCAPDSDGATPRDRWQSPPPPQDADAAAVALAAGPRPPPPRRRQGQQDNRTVTATPSCRQAAGDPMFRDDPHAAQARGNLKIVTYVLCT